MNIYISPVTVRGEKFVAKICDTRVIYATNDRTSVAGTLVLLEVSRPLRNTSSGPYAVLVPKRYASHTEFRISVELLGAINGLLVMPTATLIRRESDLVSQYLSGKPLFVEEFWRAGTYESIAMREAKAAYESEKGLPLSKSRLSALALWSELCIRAHNENPLDYRRQVFLYTPISIYESVKGTMRVTDQVILTGRWLKIADPALFSEEHYGPNALEQYIRVFETQDGGHCSGFALTSDLYYSVSEKS